MEKAYGYVPLMGHIRVGIAIFSYNGDLTFGVTGDYDTTDDIEVLCRGIERSMQELLDLADAAVRREARAAAATRPRAKPRARTATGGQSGTAASASNKRRAAG
jgi:hypothetical protein